MIHARNHARRTAVAAVPARAACGCQRSPSPSNRALQAKLRIGPADDPAEHEADRAADAVLAGEATPQLAGVQAGLQRKCAACEDEEQHTLRRQAEEEDDEELQMKAEPGGPSHAGSQAAAAGLTGTGQPLPAALRAYFEPRFGRDFSAARLHTDAAAAWGAKAIKARAFTLGSKIGFASGQYAPGTRDGLHLIAHELAHVTQQAGDAARCPMIRRRLVVDQPSSPIPNPGGKGAKQSNGDTVRDYLATLCPSGKPSVAGAGEVSLAADFCKDQPLAPGLQGPPTPSPAFLSGTPAGCGCLCDMIASANLWTIVIDDASWPHTRFDDRSKAESAGSGGSGGVVTAPSPNSTKLWGAATASGKKLDIDPWLVLGHELCGHGWLGDRGGHGPDSAARRGEGGHQATVARENLIRQEHGIEARGTFKEPYCGESYWRAKSKPGTVNWSSALAVCKQWRRDYNKKHGTKYTIRDRIP